MYPINFTSIFVSALVPLVVGFIWFNPNVLGKAWMKASGMTEEKAKGANMILIMGLSLLFNVMIGIVLSNLVVHQAGIFATLVGEEGFPDNASSPATKFMNEFMINYGDKYRSFGHGALHGVITGLFLAMPMIATHALYERRGFKYIAINAGYWIVSLAIMGGIICVWR